MSFKASKKRERKTPNAIVRGKPMIPSAAVEEWYRGQLNLVAAAMIEDYRLEVGRALKNPNVETFFATDAAAATVFKDVLRRLDKKWKDIFEGFASKTSAEFVDKSDEHSKASAWFCMSNMGIEAPKMAYTSNISNTLEAAVSFNHTLITNIQEETHEKIFSAVMLSLTSPSPEQQGQSGITNALKDIGGFTKDRIKLIARDQTSKIYSSLSDERMEQNGLDEFEWMHSSAGKVPRESHMNMNGHIFKLNDPRLWETGGEFDLKKGDLGPPGWAINCRCRKIFVIR